MPRSTLRQHLRSSWRILLKEIAAFGVVGSVAFAIDLSLFALLAPHGAVKAKIVSTMAATTFSYLGNRHWSFSHRARRTIGRETSVFFGVNAIALTVAVLVIALFVYPLGYDHDSAVVFLVNIATIGMGTIFRFWAYKRFVFLHPDKVHSPDADLDVELAE